MDKKELKFEQAIKELSAKKKDTDEIFKLIANYFDANASNINKIKEHTSIYDTGGNLNQDEYGDNKVILKMAKRFCKIHASYVMKDHPNIKVKAKNEEVPESNLLAANVQKALLNWYREQKITRKVKSSCRKGTYKGLQIFYLSNDVENKTFTFNTQDPELFAYQRLNNDNDSPLLWVATGHEYSTKALKQAFPEMADKIHDFASSRFFINRGSLRILNNKGVNKDTSILFKFMDSKYIYHYINDQLVETVEHGYPFIPYWIFPYFELDTDEWVTLIDFIQQPIKMINQAFGYRIDFTSNHADPTLKIIGVKGDMGQKKVKGGILELPENGDANYIGPQANSLDIEKLIEITKALTHFLSGLSEEAMAGFTGSLTAAGVSIELRLDSTVREALDTQIILQDILQEVNRGYLKLMEKFYPEKNLFDSSILGIKNDKKFEAKMIAGLYDNTVDFGGILPRSQDQIVRNTVTKYTTNMIPLETALAEMNYSDPNLEIAKMKSEKIQQGQLERQIQEGAIPGEKFFATPTEENIHMINTGTMANVAPEQDHELHIAVHEEMFDKLSVEMRSLFALHIQMHKTFLENKNQ